MAAKSLILFITGCCREIGQERQMPGKSRPWAGLPLFAHKVIHKICGQRQKRFSIIDLDGISQMNPSFPVQLGLNSG
jgi:hypothetical protein